MHCRPQVKAIWNKMQLCLFEAQPVCSSEKTVTHFFLAVLGFISHGPPQNEMGVVVFEIEVKCWEQKEYQSACILSDKVSVSKALDPDLWPSHFLYLWWLKRSLSLLGFSGVLRSNDLVSDKSICSVLLQPRHQVIIDHNASLLLSNMTCFVSCPAAWTFFIKANLQPSTFHVGSVVFADMLLTVNLCRAHSLQIVSS